MNYTLEERIKDAKQDWLDDQESFAQAQMETKQANEWEIKMFDWVQKSKSHLSKLELELENEQVQFIEANIQWLKDYFYKDGELAKTNDPDEFENWLSEIGNEESIRIIKAEMKKEEFAITK